MIEPELPLELAVVQLDHPAQAGQLGQALGRRVGGQVGEPVVAWARGRGGPLHDEPLLAREKPVAQDGVGGVNAQDGEAPAQAAAPGAGGEGDLLEGPGGQAPGQALGALGAAVGSGHARRPPAPGPAGPSSGESLCWVA